MKSISRKPIAIGLAAAIALGGAIVSGVPGSASAAPLAANQLAVKDAATSDVINVHRRRYHSGAAFAALALGVVSAVIAHQQYKRYRKRHYYYGYPPPYAYAPYPYYAYPRHRRHFYYY
ncbi:MAG TPA: hypothetical protein VH765_03725 [Xanthobacteraceae bacterium]|jgi:hypothetical protein